MTESHWVNNIIRLGYSFIFDLPPPLRLPPLHDPFNSPEEWKAIDTEVRTFITEKGYRRMRREGILQSYLYNPQGDGRSTPALNLRPLNQFLTAPKFKMETLTNICWMLTPDD